MAGLGEVNESNGMYLSIAGGFIWNRKGTKEDANYAEQSYVKADKSEGVRTGARYADLDGKVVGVQFKTHQEYGESINVTFEAGGERFIISISTNNRYSQDMMKMLLLADLSQNVFMKPYDFIGADKKRAMGISFRQNGEKISLKYEAEGLPVAEADFFKSGDKKKIKRFFEDLSDWYVAEVEEKVCSVLATAEPVAAPVKTEVSSVREVPPTTKAVPVKKVVPVVEAEAEEEVTEAPTAATPLKMRKALKEYMAENYEGVELPKLDRESLVRWYELCLAEEELPIEETVPVAEVPTGDVQSQLNALMEGN